jgi:hypothetical protein
MDRVMEGARVRTLAASAAGAGGLCAGLPSEVVKVSFRLLLTLEK